MGSLFDDSEIAESWAMMELSSGVWEAVQNNHVELLRFVCERCNFGKQKGMSPWMRCIMLIDIFDS